MENTGEGERTKPEEVQCSRDETLKGEQRNEGRNLKGVMSATAAGLLDFERRSTEADGKWARRGCARRMQQGDQAEVM